MKLLLAVAFLIPTSCLAQLPSFNTASVKVADPAARSEMSGGPGTSVPGRFHYGRAEMLWLLIQAYDVEPDRIVGPSWIHDFKARDEYTLDATMPAESTKPQFRLMLQSLLAERFHLKIHQETRNFPGYRLVLAPGGPKFKEAPPDPNAPDGPLPYPAGPGIGTIVEQGVSRIHVQEKTIADLIPELGPMITLAMGAGDPEAPNARVVDKTGLTAKYNFEVEFACEGCRGLGAMAANLPGLPNIFAAFEKQLGLKLEKVKDVTLDVIVVEHVDQRPSLTEPRP